MRSLLVAAALTLCAALLPAPVHAAVDGGGLPVDPFASYQPQTGCTKKPKPGTVALGQWLVATYGGSGGAVNRSCAGSSTSEHKDGRAIDWTLDADDPADRARAEAFLTAAFATDASGEPAALARRMGIMYVIWADRMYAAWNGFAPEKYLSSGCRSKKKCSKTLRHRDHVHVSLSRAGARGLTSFYVDLVAPKG